MDAQTVWTIVGIVAPIVISALILSYRIGRVLEKVENHDRNDDKLEQRIGELTSEVKDVKADVADIKEDIGFVKGYIMGQNVKEESHGG